MKLLTEFVDMQDLQLVVEADQKGASSYRIKGPFLRAEVRNKNKRRYSLPICEREVAKFNVDKIQRNRAIGELDHPPTPTVNLERASHVIESLVMSEGAGIGVARIIDTPLGRIAKTLLDEKILLGTSTRGVGTLKGEEVADDYNMITIDLVADPSTPENFVEGVLESREYIIGDDGQFVEIALEELQHKVDDTGLSRHALQYMLEFIDQVRNNIRRG